LTCLRGSSVRRGAAVFRFATFLDSASAAWSLACASNDYSMVIREML
jgi:hypothetical protein